MTTNFRTLLLLGLTGLVASLSGCILETTDRSAGGPGYGNGADPCIPNQYFDVAWQVDNGTTVLPCGSVPPSHVELTADTGAVYSVNGSCSGAGNWRGFSASAIPAGTLVVTGRLIGNSASDVLSTADIPAALQAQGAIQSCGPGILPEFSFAIAP